MRIAYVTTYDASDVHAWSGSGYYISESLKQSGFHIEYIGDLKKKPNAFSTAKSFIYRKFSSKKYLIDREPSLLRQYAKQIEMALRNDNVDIIFSPGTVPIAYLKTKLPIVFWTDATFAGMIDFYPEFSNLCAETIKNGNQMEQEALSKCKVAIYSSDWAAQTAIRSYDVDPGKVKVVPFGANINNNLNADDIKKNLDNKGFNKCNLLFIGVDWQRKGADLAIKTAEILNKEGLETELSIVGCLPSHNVPEFVDLHGFVSKRTEEGKKYLRKLFLDSHFLILPSQSDCVPVVLAEANSFGLPSLTSNVGGITTVIKNGINGFTIPLEEGPERYCDYITKLMSSPETYHKLALSSFQEYSERLNWRSAGKSVSKIINETCS